MTVNGGSAFAFLLLIVMDCAVLYYLVKKSLGKRADHRWSEEDH